MRKVLSLLCASTIAFGAVSCSEEKQQEKQSIMQTQEITQEWDKVFPKSKNVNHKKVTFHNRYGITLVADYYSPIDIEEDVQLPAIAVCGPFGAVKEQSSGLYAMLIAERGYITIAFDPSYTGESSGEPRQMASPDINTEDFIAAVDYLSTLPEVKADCIGIVGICGWGGLALNAAALDPRIKATVAMTMYDMSKVNAEGYFGSEDSPEQRMQKRKALAAQRTEDYKSGIYTLAGGVIDPLPDDAPEFVKDYHAYYKTIRGYHPRGGNSNEGWNIIGCQSFLNMPLLSYAHEIENPVLLIHGEKAHSRYFSEYAFEKITGHKPTVATKIVTQDSTNVNTGLWLTEENNVKFIIVKDASHVDLYDNLDKIPFDLIDQFFNDSFTEEQQEEQLMTSDTINQQ